VPETSASISSLFQDGGINFSVANTGDDVWDNGFVAYSLTVTRDGTLVQSDGGAMNGIAPGATFSHRVDFLGAHLAATYDMSLVVVDQVDGRTLDSQTFRYEHSTGGGGGGGGAADPATRTLVASVTSLFKDGDISFEIVNGGEDTWGPGDVAWRLNVTREGTLVQSEQEELSGVPPQGSFSKPVPFLAPGVEGTYDMDLDIFDLRTGARIGGMVGSFTESAP
jgi:hypothetical protein